MWARAAATTALQPGVDAEFGLDVLPVGPGGAAGHTPIAVAILGGLTGGESRQYSTSLRRVR